MLSAKGTGQESRIDAAILLSWSGVAPALELELESRRGASETALRALC